MRLYKEQKFTKEIDGLTVEGKFLPAMNGLQVSVHYKDKNDNVCLVNKEVMGRYNSAYPFGYIPRYECEPRARGLLIFGMNPGTAQLSLILSLSAPVAETITLNMDATPAVVEENRISPAVRA